MSPNTVPFIEGVRFCSALVPTLPTWEARPPTHACGWCMDVGLCRKKESGGDSGSWLPSFPLRFWSGWGRGGTSEGRQQPGTDNLASALLFA